MTDSQQGPSFHTGLQSAGDAARDREAARLQLALDAGRLGEWSWDIVTGVVTWSTACKALYGLPPDTEITYERFLAAIHPDDRKAADDALHRAVETRADYELEKRVIWPDGSVHWTAARGRVICDDEGTPVLMVGVTMDITDRKRTELTLRSLMESSPGLMGTFHRRPDGTMCMPYVSSRIDDLFGLRPEDVRDDATPLLARTHPDDAEHVASSIAESARTMTPWHTEYRVVHPTRGELWLEGSSVPQPHPAGGVIWHGFVHDITPRKRAEDALLKRGEEFRALAEHLPDIVIRLDAEGRYLYANPALERVAGIPVRDVIGRRVGDHTTARMGMDAPTATFEALRATFARVFSTATPADLGVTLQTPMGEQMFELAAVPEADETGRVVSVLAIAREVTARRRAEDALRASEQRFRQVMETIDEVFWLTDPDKCEMIYVSPAYARVWGRPAETLYTEPQAWIDAVHPEDRERVREAARERQALGTYDIEYRILRPDGAVRWVHDRAFPIVDAAGHVYRIAGVAEDITARRELEEQLRQSQKMEAVGQLAGGIAHDFNNLLVIIQLQTSMLLAEGEYDPVTREGIQQIMDATERATTLTRQLLTFGRRDMRRPQPLDLRTVVEDMVRLLRRLLGEHIALETSFAGSLPTVNVDPGMMEQVLLNLAVNARDAMPEGGSLRISLTSATLDASDVAAHPGAAPGLYVHLSVTDTGAGIPAEVLPHIFEPFFTTKEVGRGTGLGLATVFGIVRQHEGWIDVTTAPGQGTTFHVMLPAMSGEAASHAPSKREVPVAGGTETVLLVEDEAGVRRMARAALERYGYRVVEAASAAEALARWDEQAGAVDLLLTDLVMPGGMSGAELAAALRARAAGLRIVYSSGYSAEAVRRHLELDPGLGFLQKPYTSAELARTVRRVLDGRGGGTGP